MMADMSREKFTPAEFLGRQAIFNTTALYFVQSVVEYSTELYWLAAIQQQC